ncbi:MAG: Hsp20/alpha crystallin family protein [Nitrososphaeria archaeon]
MSENVREIRSIVRAGPGFRLGETRRSEYRLTLKLPCAVDPDKTRAAFNAIVHEITAPKRWLEKEIPVK